MTSHLDTRSAGDRRRAGAYAREFTVGIVAYVALLAAALTFAPRVATGPPRVLLALAPVLGVAWIAGAVIRHLRRADERERSRAFESLAIGFVVAMLTAVALGLLDPFSVGVPGEPWWIWSAGMLAWLVAALLQRRR